MQQTLAFGRDAGRKHHQHHQVPLYDSGVGASRVRDIFKQAKEKAPCSRLQFCPISFPTMRPSVLVSSSGHWVFWQWCSSFPTMRPSVLVAVGLVSLGSGAADCCSA